MVRLNYVNRKIDGRKLGQSVSKDLLKRIPPGSGHKAAIRDPCVELDVSGKQLADEGFQEAAHALITSVAFEGETGKIVRLEELNLRGNQLTAASLVDLGRVIALTAKDLRDLDLSNNLIAITTETDAQAWESFLSSFKKCCMLRRIDFSGNVLGQKAFEIFTRVYGKEDPVDLPLVNALSSNTEEQSPSTKTNAEDLSGLEHHIRKMSIPNRPQRYSTDPETTLRTDSAGQMPPGKETKSPERESSVKFGHTPGLPDPSSRYAECLGLRSISYIIFSDTGMTEPCASHLSWVVEHHHLPNKLMGFVPLPKAGPPTHQLEEYNARSGCRGIVYFPNENISNAGRKALEWAEEVRTGRTGSLEDSAHGRIGGPKTPHKLAGASRRPSDAPMTLINPSSPAQRRRTGSVAYSGHGSGELDRARSRIQVQALRDMGTRSNDLWRKSLEFLSIARAILLRPNQDSSYQKTKHTINQAEDLVDPKSWPSLPINPPKPRNTSNPLSPVNPNQIIGAKVFQRRVPVLDLSALMAGKPYISNQAKPPVEEKQEMPPPPLPPREDKVKGVDDEIWRGIIELATEAQGIVSYNQQLIIIAWAKDRDTMLSERDSLGKAESAQIWKVLDAMGCLAYEIKS